MIGSITKKTVILSFPTTPHNKAHVNLFYFGGRKGSLLLLNKTVTCSQRSHLLSIQQRSSWSWSTKADHRLLYVPLPALGQLKTPKRNTLWGRSKAKLLHLMNVGPVWLFFVLWPKDRPSNALSAGLCPEDTNSALEVPGTLGSSTMMVLGAAKPPHKHQGSHPLSGCWHQTVPRGKEGMHQGVWEGAVSPREVPGSVKFMAWNDLHGGDNFLLSTLLRTAFPRTSPNLDPVNSQTKPCVKACAQLISWGLQHNVQDQRWQESFH